MSENLPSCKLFVQLSVDSIWFKVECSFELYLKHQFIENNVYPSESIVPIPSSLCTFTLLSPILVYLKVIRLDCINFVNIKIAYSFCVWTTSCKIICHCLQHYLCTVSSLKYIIWYLYIVFCCSVGTPALMTPAGLTLPRYTVATTPHTYQVAQANPAAAAAATGWVHPGYIMQPPTMAHVSPYSYFHGQSGLVDQN